MRDPDRSERNPEHPVRNRSDRPTRRAPTIADQYADLLGVAVRQLPRRRVPAGIRFVAACGARCVGRSVIGGTDPIPRSAIDAATGESRIDGFRPHRVFAQLALAESFEGRHDSLPHGG